MTGHGPASCGTVSPIGGRLVGGRGAEPPVGHKEWPTESGDRPTESGDRPTESGDRPTESGDRPTESGDRPPDPLSPRSAGGDAAGRGGPHATTHASVGHKECPTESEDRPTESGDRPPGSVHPPTPVLLSQ